jgi:hypothetical protein
MVGVSDLCFIDQEISMAGNDQVNRIRTGSTGRGFACMDPERQGEIVGYVRTLPQKTPPRPVRTTGMDWMRVQPDRDASFDEGSSSRRSR